MSLKNHNLINKCYEFSEVVKMQCQRLKECRSLKVPGDQKGLFKLAVQLRKFYISVIYNTATGYVLLVYLTNI
jgi:hypothetical protein